MISALRKPTGYALLALSCIAWAALPVIPFLPLETDQKLAWSGAVFLFAEITWWLAMPLLGPELMTWCRQLWARLRSQKPSRDKL